MFIALDVRFHLLRRHQPHLMAKPAQPAAAQKVYILHKKPSLSGTLCAKPPHHERAAFRFGQANQSCVRSSQMLAPRILNTRRLGDTAKPSHPVELTMRLDRGGMGFNKRRIAREGARSSRSGTFRAFFIMHRTAVDRRKSDFQSSRFLWLTCNA